MVSAVIASAVRTPIGRFLGGLASLKATELGALAVREAVARAGVTPSDIDEVILGHVIQAGTGQAPARQASIGAGLPPTVGALTINKVCGSGLKAVMLAAQAIRAGDGRLYVAGGMESMSNAPYLAHGARQGFRLGDRTLTDSVIQDGLWCSFGQCHMGGHAEYTATRAGVTREEADRFALESHRRAIAAIDQGKFAAEIVPVKISGRRGGGIVEIDESPRRDSTLESLARLAPAFRDDAPPEVVDPVVTAGNAPGLSDGASALVVASEEYAMAEGLPIRARITAYATGSGDPRDLFFAPVTAVRRLMQQEGRTIGDYDLIEANEAFAVQALADGGELGWDWDRVNVNGGAVALGHPIGASGARILTTLLHALEDRGLGTGLATLCLGGGEAVALSIERPTHG